MSIGISAGTLPVDEEQADVVGSFDSLEGERQLAAAVMKRAVRDYQRGVEAAVLWFTYPGKELETWCTILGLDPAEVRSRARRLPQKPRRRYDVV
jgi:hypothetical protein